MSQFGCESTPEKRLDVDVGVQVAPSCAMSTQNFFQRFAARRYMTTLRSCSMIVFLFPCCAKIWHKAKSSVMNFSDASCKHSKACGWNLYGSVNSISLATSVTIPFTSLANPFFGICNSFRKCSGSRPGKLCRSATRARHVPAGCTFWLL